jgi:hypothetical protein
MMNKREDSSEVFNTRPRNKRTAPWHVGVCLKPNRDKTVTVQDPTSDVSDLHRGYEGHFQLTKDI